MFSSPDPLRAFVRSSIIFALFLCTAQGAITYRLSNHPDFEGSGNNSSDYGLRLNNLEAGGIFTIYEFDFNDARGGGMFLTYDDTLNEIRIFGSSYGGKVIGGSYSTDPDEAGIWDFDFRYRANVMATNPTDENLLEVLVSQKDGAQNNGSLALQGSTSAYTFYEDPSPGNPSGTFEFRPDGHRLGPNGTILAGDMRFVGRGWLGYDADNFSGSAGTQDWIFTAQVIPEPSSALLLGLGGIALLSRRRRATN